MPSGWSKSPKVLKGAMISFSSPMLIPIPNLIVFQYNPESLSRTLAAYTPEPLKDESAKAPDKVQKEPLSQPYDPDESFNLTLELDATDALESPASHPVAVVAGVADRIAAIEMLMYPPDDAAGGILSVSVNVSLGGLSAGASLTVDTVPRTKVPIVLLFFGPGLIVPVRILSVTVDEQQFSPILYPVKAKVTVGMKVLDVFNPDRFKDDDSALIRLAKGCYDFTKKQRQALALANLANSVESIMGMLPL